MWISIYDRMPTEQDGDALGCILIWHKYNGACVTGWHNVIKHMLPENDMITHWQRCPAPPDGKEAETEFAISTKGL